MDVNTSLPLAGSADEPLRFVGPERADPAYPDGRLRPAVGVHNIQVFRANRTHRPDGFGYTYNHAPMLAYWRGRFYLEYLSGPVHENEGPCHTLLMSSADGFTWSAPEVIFPAFQLLDGRQTIAHQRMGFYGAPSGRLLVLAFYGLPPAPNNGRGIGRAVREIHEDGSLGAIHFIRTNRHAGFDERNTPYPSYRVSEDPGFVEACEALLANKLMTQQWWEEDRSQDGFFALAGDETFSGKALSFFHRRDGMAVGIWKGAYAALSADAGATWSRPVRCPTISETYAKLWGQRTTDGRYALVYDPVDGWLVRRPLAVITGDDGITFGRMLCVHGETPLRRYDGQYKDIGPQYIRGIAEGNGMPPDGAMWLTYSVNKEDIWVSRVPVPVVGGVGGPVNDRFADYPEGPLVPGWNIYSPLWAPVRVVDAGRGHCLELRDSDPYDYARAVRVFPESSRVTLSVMLLAQHADAGRLEIEVLAADGARPVRTLLADGQITAVNGADAVPLAPYRADRWLTMRLEVDAGAGAFDLWLDGSPVLVGAAFAEAASAVERLSLRTGSYRSVPQEQGGYGQGGPDEPGADEPAGPNGPAGPSGPMGPGVFWVAEVAIA